MKKTMMFICGVGAAIVFSRLLGMPLEVQLVVVLVATLIIFLYEYFTTS